MKTLYFDYRLVALIVFFVLAGCASDGMNNTEKLQADKSRALTPSELSRFLDSIETLPFIRDIKFKVKIIAQPRQDLSYSVGFDKILVWINTEENRTGVARWASSLGGDEKKIKSTFDEHHRQLGVESIDLMTFFKRDEVPGLFDIEETEVAGTSKWQEKTSVGIPTLRISELPASPDKRADERASSERLTSSDSIEPLKPFTRDFQFYIDLQSGELIFESFLVWINTEENRTGVARWASSLGGDEKKIKSTLDEYYRQLGVESIDIMKFFRRDEVPGLFDDR